MVRINHRVIYTLTDEDFDALMNGEKTLADCEADVEYFEVDQTEYQMGE